MNMRRASAFIALIALMTMLPMPSHAQTAPPVIYFSDLTSGPNSGGENNAGVYVTIYGKNFGATQANSFVTVGCGKVATYQVWSDTKITFQLGSAAQTGDIVVNIPGVALSNGVPFTVRAGNIYCLSKTGKDTNTGLLPDKCFATLKKIKATIKPGDTVYIRAGIYTSADQYGAVIAATLTGGTTALPYAFVGYPNESVTLGQDLTNTPTSTAVLAPSIRSGPFSGYVIAGMNLRGFDSGINLKAPGVGPNRDWRVVGNDFRCQSGATPGGSACFEATFATQHITMLGNYVHDISTAVPNSTYLKLYHAVYFGGSYLDIGWNTIARVQACRAFQTHATAGPDQHDIFFHDNVVHDVRCDCVNISTVNPKIGPVSIYNNVLYACGQGPDPSGQISNYSCIYDGGGTDNKPDPADPPRGGVIQAYNNTMADCGSGGTGNKGGIVSSIASNQPVPIVLTNNIVVQKPGEVYVFDVAANGGLPSINGDTNLFFGVGGPPARFTNSINLDPLFLVPFSSFELQAASPALGAAVASVAPPRDSQGTPRPAKPALGALDVFVPGKKPSSPGAVRTTAR